MNFLAIDASTEACSVAINFQGKTYSEFELCPQSHSLVLLPMVDRLLKISGAKLSDFDALIYGRGPGSFTGVRIGIGVAQGLAFSADIPTIGISTMQAMAQQAFEEGAESALVAIDARMSEIYTAEFKKNEQGHALLVDKERVVPPSEIEHTIQHSKKGAKHYAVGTGWNAYTEQLSHLQENSDVTVLYPNAKYMLPLGEAAFAREEALPAEQAQPVYVRDTVSWKKLPGRE